MSSNISERFVCGFVGPSCPTSARKVWNGEFKKQNIDAFFDAYKAKNRPDLELRLSEMFLLERRGYIIHPSFAETIVPLLDELDESVKQAGRVDTVINTGGILKGYWVNAAVMENIESRMVLFIGQ